MASRQDPKTEAVTIIDCWPRSSGLQTAGAPRLVVVRERELKGVQSEVDERRDRGAKPSGTIPGLVERG